MTLRSVMVQLRPEQIERLDAESTRTGVSRSQVVRDAVDRLFSEPFDRDVAEVYRRAYPDARYGVDEWGDRDAWHSAAAQSRGRDACDSW